MIESERPVTKESWLRRAYHWTLAWAEHPQAQWALFFIALIEASVFPIPPDILLLALALGRPELALRFAAVCTAGSTVGAIIGYLIGMLLFASIAEPVLQFYGVMEQFHAVEGLFLEWGLLLVLVAGFSPIPFKVITIAAGAFGLPFIGFVLTALLSRGARFFLEGALLRWGGDDLRAWVEKHFEWATLAVGLLVVLGFLGLWLLS
ncbi:MAG: cytochrome B [Proteobacteria bacterium]|nr:MAG: cytochrome B [Pseudomonadota bacterium]